MILKSLRYGLLSLLLFFSGSNLQAQLAEKPASPPIFIETTIDNPMPWVGQEVRLTYTLFFRDAAPGIEDKTKPDHPGLWVREINPENYINSTPVSVKGVLFRKAIIKQLRVVPMQSGKLSVANYRLKCLIPKNGEVTLDSRNDTETLVTAPPAMLQATALPTPAPAGFSGAVGLFSLSVSPETDSIHAGELLRLSITLAGTGNLDAQPMLTVILPEGVRKESSAVPAIVSTGNTPSAQASVTTRISLMPEHAGLFRFRPVRLTFFNPKTERYQTISSNEVTVRVFPAAAPTVQPQMKVLSPIRLPAKPADPWSPVMITLSGSVLLLIFGLHRRNMNKKRKVVPSAAGPKQPDTPKSPASSVDQTQATQKSPESLRSELYEAIKNTGIANPSGMTSKDICTRLEMLNISPQTVAEAGKLLATIDHALYTPGDTNHEQLVAMNRRAAQVITNLRSLR
ncbi:MAG: protein BatD [Chlorobiaceae bacterium]|nr:protein BatD [Chlorobiaceae bacterium]